MILVFLLLILLFIIMIIVFILSLSNIKIKIEKLHISNTTGKVKLIFISEVSVFIFNKFKLFEKNIDDKKIKNIINNQKLNIKKIQFSNTVEIIEQNEIVLEELNISGHLGLEDAAFTAYIVSFINALIPIVLSRKLNKYNPKKYKYNIIPVYVKQNIVNLEINCIISLKIVHIINILFKLLRKGRVKRYERSSNRRSYAYSNE